MSNNHTELEKFTKHIDNILKNEIARHMEDILDQDIHDMTETNFKNIYKQRYYNIIIEKLFDACLKDGLILSEDKEELKKTKAVELLKKQIKGQLDFTLIFKAGGLPIENPSASLDETLVNQTIEKLKIILEKNKIVTVVEEAKKLLPRKPFRRIL